MNTDNKNVIPSITESLNLHLSFIFSSHSLSCPLLLFNQNPEKKRIVSAHASDSIPFVLVE